MASAITWFQIPATDMARAKEFYETICDFELEPAGRRPRHGDVAASRPTGAQGEIGGAIVCGEGAVPSATGTAVFLNAQPRPAGRARPGRGGRRHASSCPRRRSAWRAPATSR